MNSSYDAILVVSFGGPEGPDDVLPFLENVLRGRRVPRERMMEVAEHYQHFGGVSPINSQNRALIAALQKELSEQGMALPVFWGNRNWHPFLSDTLRQMQRKGVRHALALVTSAFSSYSGCRQYREDIQRAREQIGPQAPQVSKLRAFFNHPGFIATMAARLEEAMGRLAVQRRDAAHVVFTAHSIPVSMAAGCAYETQLRESARLIGESVGLARWRLVYQSRSGPPHQQWLEPDIGEYLKQLASDVRSGATSSNDVVVVPLGFVSDHMEVRFDLDTEAAGLCRELGLNLIRCATAGTHPRFVTMIRELIEERVQGGAERVSVGSLPACPDVCPADCCLPRPAGSVVRSSD